MKLEKHKLLLVLALVCLLPACGRDELGYDDEEAEQARIDQLAREAVAKTPPIHIQQTVTWQEDGSRGVAGEYRQLLASCYEDGAYDAAGQEAPIVPLPEDVVEKLDAAHFEAWYQGARAAARYEAWGYGHVPGSLCEFEGIHASHMMIGDPDDGTWIIDLNKGVGSFASGGTRRRPIVDVEQQMTDALRQAGFDIPDEVKDPRNGVATVAGEACYMSFRDNVKQCLWTRGEQWGLGLIAPPFSWGQASLPYYMGGFALEYQPISGPGYHLTTDLITVGESFDQSVFSVPPGIKRAPADGDEDDADSDPESDDAAGESDDDE